jgi:alkanesulfonate monooxygenase SsuD/methylene tetrahydromethanopterin reductase-like flavin-dependent oxidoreductase (luciferase family)
MLDGLLGHGTSLARRQDPSLRPVRHGLFLPIFGELSNPRVTAGLAAEAEKAGFDGVFVWDHVHYRMPATHVADAWITLAAIAATTDHVRLGPLVTPLPRRRPQVVARQATALDQLSGGRAVLGVGAGRDSARELSAFGEELDDRVRAQMLDEALDVITALWTGEDVHHQGRHYRADGVAFRPTPVQRPRIPVWVAGRWPYRRPLQRAARYDGYFPIDLAAPDQLVDLLGDLHARRAAASPMDVVVEGRPGDDPAPWAAAGATWWLIRFSPFDVDAAVVRRVIAAGPPA